MDTKAYISSGILEEYVLGITSIEDSETVAANALLYPEIAAYIEECREALSLYTYVHNNVVAKAEKETIWQKIQNTSANSNNNIELPKATESPAAPAMTLMDKRPSIQYLVAASIALLIGSGIANVILWSKNADQNELIADLHTSQQKNEETIAANQKIITEYNTYASLANNPDVQKVNLQGVAGHEASKALVLWDNKTKDVYLAFNNLPEPPTDKQYQLWAIVDGKPVDAGVFNTGTPIIQLKNIPKAEMFAVTLENKGGSASPTMDQMHVAGKI